MAEDAADPAAEEIQQKDQVPEDLNLLHFLGREELSDCSIRLPASGALPAQEVKCHRLALCSTSGYCFQKFLAPDAPSSLDLPELPDDAELRRQMPLQSLFQLVLRFAYGGQKWEALEALVTPESCPGLYALAKLLDARALVMAVDEAMDLNAGTAPKLLYVASQLKDQADFQSALDRSMEVVRDGFGALCLSPHMGLLAKLPVSLLVRLLEQDALNVPQEENVLRFVRHVLWRRLLREEKLLTLSGGLEGLESEGLQLRWESMAAEDADGLSPAVDRYSASEVAPEGSADIPELSHRMPAESGTSITLTALKGEEVLFAAKLPINLEEPAAEDLRQEAFLDGKSVTIRYKYTLSEAPPEDLPEAPAAPAAPSGAEGAEDPPEAAEESTKPDAALNAEETKRLLGVVRFGQLDHQQLLLAVKDPVLEKAGAQPHLLGALSARLAVYEAAEAAETAAPCARPSTRGQPAPQAPQAPQAPTATAPVEPPTAPPQEGGPVLLRGSMGATLFPCTCGEGRMQLRQAEGRFVARCNRLASCGQAFWLPSSVVAAAVDGHCAVCALRLGAEVRTLTVRLGRDQCRALRKLPSGVDTLRGMCIAGCHDMLSILG